MSLATFKAYLRNEAAADDQFLTAALSAAEKAINSHCARKFDAPSGGATTRKYLPRGNPYRDEVVIHDIVDATGITILDDTASVNASDVQFEPIQPPWDGSIRPYYVIRRLRSAWSRDGERATVSVTTDRWGWSAVPDEVIEAMKLLAKDLVHMRDTRFGVQGLDGFVVRVRPNSDPGRLLGDLRHPRAVVVG